MKALIDKQEYPLSDWDVDIDISLRASNGHLRYNVERIIELVFVGDDPHRDMVMDDGVHLAIKAMNSEVNNFGEVTFLRSWTRARQGSPLINELEFIQEQEVYTTSFMSNPLVLLNEGTS